MKDQTLTFRGRPSRWEDPENIEVVFRSAPETAEEVHSLCQDQEVFDRLVVDAYMLKTRATLYSILRTNTVGEISSHSIVGRRHGDHLVGILAKLSSPSGEV